MDTIVKNTPSTQVKWLRRASLILALLLLLTACNLPFLTSPAPVQTPAPEVPQATLVPAVATQTSPQLTSTVTNTPEPTPLPTFTATLTAVPVQDEQAVSADIIPRYVLQAGTPLGIANFVEPEAGCNWMGVGGQVFGLDGVPKKSLLIEIGGTLNDQDFLGLGLTGGATVFGEGGYLIKLANLPVAVDNTLWIQIFDVEGQPQTAQIPFSTYADCERNFILINFAEVQPSFELKLILPNLYNNR